MPSLSRELRRNLENVTKDARARAEDAARAALENLAVHETKARGHMDEPKRKLRAALRARGKALGDARASDGSQELTRLVEHTAYEHWHRLLFTRFLTENHLLLMPDDAGGAPTPVTVEECDELAPELGAKDGFDLACRFAGKTLPGVFRADDPVLDLAFAPEGQVALRKLLESLPSAVFTTDDSLGWTYQFWQAQRKKDISESEVKIGAAELSPVTQLFTEDYMVEFLLHNTLGAWWAGRSATLSNFKSALSNASTEAEARAAVALPPKNGAPGIEWTYLRFVRDDANKVWSPAAGTFSGWPRTARALTMLDPCMGSGHFLVFALPLFVRLRIEEENLSAAAAIAAVLRDNLHGLELDERCTQIAAFNLALAAWKLAGYQPLPALHLACSGLAPHTTQAEWVALAGSDEKLQRGMARLYKLFEDAPVLGSLINPRAGGGDLLTAGFDELRPLVEKALAPATDDDTTREMAVTARGLAKAAELLSSQFFLVATNVPFKETKQLVERSQTFISQHYYAGRVNLATAFILRIRRFLAASGTAALVTPHEWLFLKSYAATREILLTETSWQLLADLGEKAFQSQQAAGAFTALITLSESEPRNNNSYAGWDATGIKTAEQKAAYLSTEESQAVCQSDQLKNPDARIGLSEASSLPLLSKYAGAYVGLQNGDTPRFVGYFWELPAFNTVWSPFQLPCDSTKPYGGREGMLRWENGKGTLSTSELAYIKGREAWGKKGIAIRQTRSLPATGYSGDLYDQSSAAIMPHDPAHLSAIWAYCFSPQFHDDVRKIDKKKNVTNATLVKVPFDLGRWQKEAEEKYSSGLPVPSSCDPTQWLFDGSPLTGEQPLHVAVLRLLGYKWPRQTGTQFPECGATKTDNLEMHSDDDGIVCLPPINRELTAANRLRKLLTAALGSFDEQALLLKAGTDGSKSTTLELWLRDEFFEQHCELFYQRPFIWHRWDGLKDGFHVLVNYHRLDQSTLEKLTFSYLGEWIRQQADDAKADKPGAAARLGAAQALQEKLKAVLTGEAPHDIFVRWKPLREQPLGWQPDLNDGVRPNIRPFMLVGDVFKSGAGILRSKPNIKWDKDRGGESASPRNDFPWLWIDNEPATDPKPDKDFAGHRWNCVHLTLQYKHTTRLSKS
jgi:hypothetical protein